MAGDDVSNRDIFREVGKLSGLLEGLGPRILGIEQKVEALGLQASALSAQNQALQARLDSVEVNQRLAKEKADKLQSDVDSFMRLKYQALAAWGTLIVLGAAAAWTVTPLGKIVSAVLRGAP